MKKYISILMAALMVAMTGFYSCKKDNTKPNPEELPLGQGDGTVTNPFKVITVQDLQRVGTGEVGPGGFKWERNLNYQQIADIDLSVIQNWTPLCNGYNKPFSGTYNGAGKTISNLKIIGNGREIGLFANVSGTVRNVRLTNIDISGNDYIGGIAGMTTKDSDALIDHCYVNIKSIFGEPGQGHSNVGGIVGWNYSTVTNCIVTGENFRVKGIHNVGGIAGLNYRIIKNCYTSVNVRGYSDIGGIVGCNSPNAIVQYCYATGNITADSYNTGGIVGTNHSQGFVQNCVALSSELMKNENTVIRYIGRICPEPYNLSDNYARSDMKLWYFTNSAVPSSTDNKSIHGANVSAADYCGANSGTWWKNTAGFPDAQWSFAPNRLPWLNGFDGLTQNPTIIP